MRQESNTPQVSSKKRRFCRFVVTNLAAGDFISVNAPKGQSQTMKFQVRPIRFVGLHLCLAGFLASAQEPLTLRQAIQQALGESPEVKVAAAGSLEAKTNASLARTQLLPQINFAEDISRGNDPVYAFGTKL